MSFPAGFCSEKQMIILINTLGLSEVFLPILQRSSYVGLNSFAKKKLS